MKIFRRWKAFVAIVSSSFVLLLLFANCGRGFQVSENSSFSLQASNQSETTVADPIPNPAGNQTPAPLPTSTPVRTGENQATIMDLMTSMKLTNSKLSAQAGQSLNFTLQFSSAPLKENYSVFFHLTDSQGEGLLAQTTIVPNPISTSWNGVYDIPGRLTIPANAKGKYILKAGLFNSKNSTNIPLVPGSGVIENNEVAPYGSRYRVGELDVTAPPPSGNPLLLRQVKLMVIGDSMTAGSEADPKAFRSYRGRLYQLLRSAGIDVDIIGSNQSTPAIGGDPHHDGYGGAYIGPGGNQNNLWDRLNATLAGREPDVIVLALGWNSVYNETALAGSKYRAFVNRIAAMKPSAHIVVATLSPQRGETEAQTAGNNGLQGYGQLNSTARSLGNASASDRIYLADLAMIKFTPSDYWDVIHWLQPGADKSAKVIFDTIMAGPLKP